MNTNTINTSKQIADVQTLLSQVQNSLTSLDDLKEFRKLLSADIRNHVDYVSPVKKEHLENREKAIVKILSKVLGFNAAFKELKKLIKEDENFLIDCVASDKTLVDNQVKFVLTSLPKLKHFMSDAMKAQNKFTPKDILNTVLKVGTMKPTNYSKRVATFS